MLKLKFVLQITQPDLGIEQEFLVKGLDNEFVKNYYNLMVQIAVYFGTIRARAEILMKESLEFEIELAKVSEMWFLCIEEELKISFWILE